LLQEASVVPWMRDRIPLIYADGVPASHCVIRGDLVTFKAVFSPTTA
jgi:hypothetical protein